MHARDPAELYKDKIEVSLDGRQIFYLFFGGAVVVGLVFVLGVMVGRRVEARGHVDLARTAAAADPLAALDRLEGPAGGLSSKGTLMGAQASTEVERTIGELEKAGVVKPAPGAVIEKKIEKKSEPKPEKAEKTEKAEPKVEKAERAELRPEKTEKTEKAEPKVEKAEKAEKLDRKDREPREREKDRDRDARDRDGKDREPKKKKKGDGDSADAGSSRFTLQLSAFQDRQEADAFMSTLKAAGFQAYVNEADVGSKGTFYRVRIGSYRSADAAQDAKAELERVTKKNASVMRL
jgi:cell division septation protein DedD